MTYENWDLGRAAIAGGQGDRVRLGHHVGDMNERQAIPFTPNATLIFSEKGEVSL
jgi:hypothetical protein